MKKLIVTLSVFSCFNVFADLNENSVWQNYDQKVKQHIDQSSAKNIKQRRLLLDESLLKNRLSSSLRVGLAARGLRSKSLNSIIPEIKLPLPDGSQVRVKATPSQVMTAAMAESYPELKTWNIIGIDDPDIKGSIDFTTNGFHGMLMMPDGDTIFIDPDKDQSGDVYKSFSKRQNPEAFDVEFNCGIEGKHDHQSHMKGNSKQFAVNTAARALSNISFPDLAINNVKTYRLALSATAEYTDSQGGTAAARSSMVTSINRINPVFIRDLGVSLELIDAPNLIFSDSTTDPFSDFFIPTQLDQPGYPSVLMRENGDYVSDQGLLGDFDLGHVLSHVPSGGGSGVAFLGVACRNDLQTSNLGLIKGLKAAGASTSPSPSGATFDLELLAHELGHQ